MSKSPSPAPSLDADDIRLVAKDVLTSGRVEAVSLSASYGFTIQTLQQSSVGALPIRVWLHEHMHVYQAMATSYGYYTAMLRMFQNTRVVRVIREIGSSSAGLEPPLLRQAGQLKGAAAARVAREIHAWLTAECVLLHLEGDVDRYSTLATSSVVGGRSLADMLAETETMMIDYFRADLHNLGPIESAPVFREDLNLESLMFSMKGFFAPGSGDVLSVLESGARAAEWWRAWPATFDELEASMPNTNKYTIWIKYAQKVLTTPNPRSFLLTYSALVDVALNPPLLPHHAHLRRTGISTGEMNPLWRLISSIQRVRDAHIPVIEDLDQDYKPFIENLCKSLGWPTPTELADVSVERLPHPLQMSDPMTANYKLASLLRCDNPVAFLNMDVWWDSSERAKAFCGKFSHPLVEFADDGTYMFDVPQDSVTYVEQFLLHQFFNQLMTSQSRPLPPIELPYRATKSELNFYTTKLEQTIRRRTGLQQPRVRLAAGAPSHSV